MPSNPYSALMGSLSNQPSRYSPAEAAKSLSSSRRRLMFRRPSRAPRRVVRNSSGRAVAQLPCSTLRSPWLPRSRSRMTFGLRSDTVYEETELRKPGWNSSVTAAPPTTPRRSRTVTFSPAAARYAAHTSPLWPPPTMRTSRVSVLMAFEAPTSLRGAGQPALRDQLPHAPREAPQAYLSLPQRAWRIPVRRHAFLNTLDQLLVFHVDLPVDAPVEVTRRAHLPAIVRKHVGDLPDQGLRRGDRYELHEIDLIRIDVECHAGPELEVGPQPLPVLRQVLDPGQQRLVASLGPVGGWSLAQPAPHLVDPGLRLDAVAVAEEPREPRVRHGNVQAVGIIIGDVLPVDRARPQRHPALRHELFQAVRLELMEVRRCHLAHARQSWREAHEHETHEDFLLERREAVPLRLQPLVSIALRHGEQPPVEAVRPRVIRTGDSTSTTALGPVEEPRGAVPAGVMEAADLAVFTANRDDALAQEVERMEVAAARHVVDVADDLPALAEDELPLQLEKLRVAVYPARQADGLPFSGGDDVDRTSTHDRFRLVAI